jgi:guanosine-3',5'-bis(diphosphate) 3'-pyrophosphohydrolase
MDELYADIGIGKRMPALVARHIFGLIDGDVDAVPAQDAAAGGELDPVTIYGSEGVSVQLAPCCLPIPGDQITGQLRRDQGLVVHTATACRPSACAQGTGPLDRGAVGQ